MGRLLRVDNRSGRRCDRGPARPAFCRPCMHRRRHGRGAAVVLPAGYGWGPGDARCKYFSVLRRSMESILSKYIILSQKYLNLAHNYENSLSYAHTKAENAKNEVMFFQMYGYP